MASAPAVRGIPRWRPQGTGRPPRQAHRQRRAPGPAGTPIWEDVLPGEVRRRALEDLVLHLQHPQPVPQLDELLVLLGRQTRLAAGIDRITIHPVPKTGLADPEFTRGLADRVSLGNQARARRRNSGGWAAGISRTPSETIIASKLVSGKAGQAPMACAAGVSSGSFRGDAGASTLRAERWFQSSTRTPATGMAIGQERRRSLRRRERRVSAFA